MSATQAFIISRYNLYVEHMRRRIGIDSRAAYLDWCASRADLFSLYTLPSVVQQTCQNFTWLIYFDTEMNEHVERVLEQINPNANILPMFFNNREGAEPLTWHDSVRRTLVSKHFTGIEKITTTRLDTDDCLHQNFMSKMLGVADRLDPDSLREQPIAISFPFGAQEIGSRLLSHHQATNAFITLVEAATRTPSTVFRADHNKVHTFAHLKNVILQQPMWLQVIHGNNVSNAEKPNLPELGPREELLRQFGVTADRSSRRRSSGLSVLRWLTAVPDDHER